MSLFVYTSLCLCVYVSLSLLICLCLYTPLYLSFYVSVYMSLCLSFYVSVCIHLSIFLSMSMCICLSVSPSMSLFVYTSLSLAIVSSTSLLSSHPSICCFVGSTCVCTFQSSFDSLLPIYILDYLLLHLYLSF